MIGRAACRGDFDNDGRVDVLLVQNSGQPRLLHNESTPTNNWITVKLVGTTSNRDAYGAKVILKTAAATQTGYCSSGSSYLSAHDSRLHFGLGSSNTIDLLTVRWPNGQTEEWRNVPPDRIVTLTEGAAPKLEQKAPKPL
jgi:hypothetical protein